MTAQPAIDLFTPLPEVDRDVFGLPQLAGAVPDSVLIGLGRLSGGPPLWGTEIEWRELVERLRAWSCRWHAAAAAGWDVVALYGVSAHAPQVRREMMGGAWLANLSGHQTVAVDRDAIRLVARTAARLSVYRAGARWRACVGASRRRGTPAAAIMDRGLERPHSSGVDLLEAHPSGQPKQLLRTTVALEQSIAPDASHALLMSVGIGLREDLVATEPTPPSLMKLLAQLEARVQANITREELYAAIDRAVAEAVHVGRGKQ